MPVKILLIDNEDDIRLVVKEMIHRLTGNVHTADEATGVVDGLQKINSFNPDIVFLDVEMDDGTGFDLLQQINNPGFQLIFTTAHNQYAIQAFKFSAIDYLLKPVDPAELSKSLQKAIENINEKNLAKHIEVLMQRLQSKDGSSQQIVLRDMEKTYFIKTADILYCEAEGSYTKFYFSNSEPIFVSNNLKEYEDMLKPMGFIRTHHSYLVNPEKIKMYDKTDGGMLILEGGYSIPLSQRKRDAILQMLEKR